MRLLASVNSPIHQDNPVVASALVAVALLGIAMGQLLFGKLCDLKGHCHTLLEKNELVTKTLITNFDVIKFSDEIRDEFHIFVN